jgi:hypothetical protein
MEGQIILDSHLFMRDEKAINWRETFPQTSIGLENKLKKRSWEAFGLGVFCFVVWRKRKT